MGFRTFYQTLNLYDYQEWEIAHLRCLEDNEGHEDAYSVARMLASINGYDSEGLLAEFQPDGVFQSRATKRATMDMVMKFISLIAFMHVNGEDNFDSFRRNYDLRNEWRDKAITQPEYIFLRWMERICCPVRDSNGHVEVQQFSPFLICALNQVFGVYDCDSLGEKLTDIANSTDHRFLSLDQKRCLVKAFDDLLDDEDTNMCNHFPMKVPMYELDVWLTRLGFRNCDVHVLHDIVGPRSLYHRLVASKVNIISCSRLTKGQKVLILKAIVYMEEHTYCGCDVDKISNFPYSDFDDWKDDQLVPI